MGGLKMAQHKVKGYLMDDGEYCVTNISAVVKVIYDCLHQLKKISKQQREIKTVLEMQQIDFEEMKEKLSKD